MGELERAVMEHLWSVDGDATGTDGWRTVREVHEALAADREIAYTTVMTVMDRLSKKSLVRQRKEGKAYLYRAADSRGAMTADLMRSALTEFAEGDRTNALLAFVGESTEEEREALRRALVELE
jgi:predicted transcriptional regulator